MRRCGIGARRVKVCHFGGLSAGSEHVEGASLTSISEMSRFETELLAQKGNLNGLERLNVEWLKRAMTNTVYRRVILDIDIQHFGCRLTISADGHKVVLSQDVAIMDALNSIWEISVETDTDELPIKP